MTKSANAQFALLLLCIILAVALIISIAVIMGLSSDPYPGPIPDIIERHARLLSL